MQVIFEEVNETIVDGTVIINQAAITAVDDKWIGSKK